MKHICNVCGYVYDEEFGVPDVDIAPSTKWDFITNDFVCPECGVGKEQFSPE